MSERAILDRRAGALADIPLFAGIAAAELERVEHFMMPFRAEPGDVLFRQGEQGERIYVIERGRVEVQVELTGGTVSTLADLGPTDLLGEMSLLGVAQRSGSAIVRELTHGWLLHRSGLEMLRMDAGAGAVELVARMTEVVLERLRARYDAISAELAVDDAEPAPTPSCDAFTPAAPRLASRPYLASLLCFGHFHDDEQIETAIGGATPVELAPGAFAMAPDVVPGELLLVLRGALDVSIRRGHSARRVRLAGPGRYVGHVGALDGRPSPVVAHAREHVVLLPLPAQRVRAMLRDPSAPARRFSAGLAEDMARAMRHADRPTARVAAEPMPLSRA
jgi:CRP-like cAMP-binding protein